MQFSPNVLLADPPQRPTCLRVGSEDHSGLDSTIRDGGFGSCGTSYVIFEVRRIKITGSLSGLEGRCFIIVSDGSSKQTLMWQRFWPLGSSVHRVLLSRVADSPSLAKIPSRLKLSHINLMTRNLKEPSLGAVTDFIFWSELKE